MRRAAPQSTAGRELRALICELVDAHADTVELSLTRNDELRWAAHLDYLRALQRTANRILARTAMPAEPR